MAAASDPKRFAHMLLDPLRRAATLAVHEASRGLRSDLQAMTARTLGQRMAATWRAELYPKGDRVSLQAAGHVYTRAPKVIHAFDADSMVIGPTRGRYLAIPTGFNKRQGQRRAGGGPLIGTAEMAAMGKGWTFVRPGAGGSLVWFLKVVEAQRQKRKNQHALAGTAQRMAFAGGRLLVGGGRRGRTDAALTAGAVPMFILSPEARMPRRLAVRREVAKAQARLPDLFAHYAARLR